MVAFSRTAAVAARPLWGLRSGAAPRVAVAARFPGAGAVRRLGDSVRGPQALDVQANLRYAKDFFTKGAVSYAEYKQQCVSLRLFVVAGVTAGCCVALLWDPPKSSYWATWGITHWPSQIKAFFGGSSTPLFLQKSDPDRTDVARIFADAVAGTGAAASGAAAAGAPAAPGGKGNFKVCVCGGSGGIGQPLSLLMAMDDNVAEVSVYDLSIAMVPPGGVAADLSHLEKKAKVKGYQKNLDQKAKDVLEDCLTGCSLVLVPAGMPRKPGQTRDDLFKINANIAKDVVEACAKYCPNAMVALIVNPVNSVVPAMAELYKKKGLDPKRIVGVTSLDGVRANKFVAEITGANPSNVNVPVVGGHAGVTILPLFSQDKFASKIPADQIPDLDKHVQDAGTDVVNAKNGKGSATLSMAYAGARLGKKILAGLAGTPTDECAYVLSDVRKEVPYFTSRVTFGPNGVEKVHPLGKLNAHEEARLKEAIAALKKEVQSGLDFAKDNELEF